MSTNAGTRRSGGPTGLRHGRRLVAEARCERLDVHAEPREQLLAPLGVDLLCQLALRLVDPLEVPVRANLLDHHLLRNLHRPPPASLRACPFPTRAPTLRSR